MKATLAILLALSLLVAACGNDDDTQAGSDSAETAAGEADTAEGRDDAGPEASDGSAPGSNAPDGADLLYHDAYWVAEVEPPGAPAPVIQINDMHIDIETNRATVYAQMRLMGKVVSPPQVDPGECTETQAGDRVCHHPNAVYLNGSGEELQASDGTGAWWVKHSWVLGGEGYYNCPIAPAESYDNCIDVEGVLLDDGITMKIGGVEPGTADNFNTRVPLIDRSPVAYNLITWRDDGSGPVEESNLVFECQEVVSPFDGSARTCPNSPDPTGAQPGSAQTEEAADGETTDQPGGGGFSLNGFRYCEILLTVEGDNGAPVSEVWGTQGVGPCRDDAWRAIDADALVAEFEASGVRMNGPRYFVVDGSVDTAAAADDEEEQKEIRAYGGIDMQLLATIDGGIADAPYNPVRVLRTATWTFNAGTEVYELTDSEGNTYLMQSYSLIQEPDLTADDLASLGDRLELPDGWSYNARVLDQDMQVPLAPDGGAIVVQDELENSYQRSSF
jgi:hypothetical protein